MCDDTREVYATIRRAVAVMDGWYGAPTPDERESLRTALVSCLPRGQDEPVQCPGCGCTRMSDEVDAGVECDNCFDA